jgi:hypothetical protein
VIERYIGSSEPVSLLPYISHRISLPLYKSISGTYLDENLKLFTTESAAPEPTSVINAQSPTQEEQRDSRPPHTTSWVLEEVLYSTPPGYGFDGDG